MAQIIIRFGANGTKQVEPRGYGGGLCKIATAPYEQLDAPGTAVSTPTEEAKQPEAILDEPMQQQQRA